MFEANEDHLREAYEKYGEVVKAVVARDARGLSRGYVRTSSQQDTDQRVCLLIVASLQLRLRMVHR